MLLFPAATLFCASKYRPSANVFFPRFFLFFLQKSTTVRAVLGVVRRDRETCMQVGGRDVLRCGTAWAMSWSWCGGGGDGGGSWRQWDGWRIRDKKRWSRAIGN